MPANLALAETNLAEVSKQDIDAIIQARETALQALNSRDFSQIKPYIHPTFTITTVDNQVFHNVTAFEKYWKKQLAGPIKNIQMQLQVDDSRTFLSPQIAVYYGDAFSTFYFADGNMAKMNMRWTAVMQKVQNIWMIQSLHFSSNLLDNPVLNAANLQGKMMMTIAGVGGLVLGGLGMWLLRRKPQTLEQG